ncbi:hypothetical protein MMC17_004506 [Xylographa soralifera]|nr:hypothetical protein [Xylographa soralifera]
MADPLTIFGAVGTSVQLGSLIMNLLDDFVESDKNVRVLSLRIKDDVSLLQQFLQYIHGLPRDTFGLLDDAVLVELNNYLQPLMARCEARIKAVRSPGLQPKQWGYNSRRAIKEIEEMANDLAAWKHRLHIRTSLLSKGVKLDLAKQLGARDANSAWQYHVGIVQEEMRRLRELGTKMDYKALEVEKGVLVDFGHAPHESRMLGMFQGQQVLVEFVDYNRPSLFESTRDSVGELAINLNLSKPSSLHVLRCLKFFHNRAHLQFGFIFELPSDESFPRSLSTILGGHSDISDIGNSAPSRGVLATFHAPHHPLNHRFRFARDLATSLLYIHSFGWQHKSIRSHNVLVFEDIPDKNKLEISAADQPPSYHQTIGEASLGRPFLTGFQHSRSDMGESTKRVQDSDWKNNIYRSPDRIASTDESLIKRHEMRDDVYSLGVVLLELGIWRSLVAMEGHFKDQTALGVQKALLRLAREDLPQRMGKTYTSVVLYCLMLGRDDEVGNLTFVREVLGKLEELANVV